MITLQRLGTELHARPPMDQMISASAPVQPEPRAHFALPAAGKQTELKLTQGVGRICRTHIAKTAVICGSERLSWADLAALIARLAALLRGQGVISGARDAILNITTNAWHPEWNYTISPGSKT